jgi:alpha-1,2-mannosyltransferase
MGVLFSGLIANFVLAPFTLPLSFRIVGIARRWDVRRNYNISRKTKVIAFFHPNCSDDGGGGERVLWRAIYAISEYAKRKKKDVHIVIYIGGSSSVSKSTILHRVREVFGIDLTTVTTPITLVHVRSRTLLNIRWYPVFTIMGQSLGAMVLACECLLRFTPDVFFDTTGWASTYLPARVMGCEVGAYVHYPTVSIDKLQKVKKELIPRGWLSTRSNPYIMLKLMYYYILVIAYFCMGCLTRVAMVNSKWTEGHMKKLWRFKGRSIKLVYPPCNTAVMQELSLDETSRTRSIISLSRFREEKDHGLQLRAFSLMKQSRGYEDVTMVIAGGYTNSKEFRYFEKIKLLSKKLGLEESVTFSLNRSQSELAKLLGSSSIGLHTMQNEHFGIAIVEMMSAGLVVIAHNSGGPASDIIINSSKMTVGYLCSKEEEYAQVMRNVFDKKIDVPAVRQAARESAKKFSDEAFDLAFIKAFQSLL